MIFSLTFLVFVVLGPLHTVLGDNFKFEPNCVPACTATSAPLTDMQPCMCRPDAIPTGCQIPPCGPGEDSTEDFTCQCTEYFQPNQCVTLSCDNGTMSYGPSCPPYSSSPSYYPSTSYPTQSYAPAYYPAPTQSYPSSNYQTPSYPPPNYQTPSYPPPNYQTTSYPSPSYQYQQYGYTQPSYNPYPSSSKCNQYCVCEPYLPADCNDDSEAPIAGAPNCACQLDNWETGCTVKPCQSADDSYCECTATFQPSKCFTPRCSPS